MLDEREFHGKVSVVRKAFPLVTQENARAVFDNYLITHRRWAGQQEGAPRFTIPAPGTAYPHSSLPALEATKWMEEHRPDRVEPFEFAVFEAFFDRVEDISSTEVLLKAAGKAGIRETTSLKAALADHRYGSEVLADFRQAIERYRTTGIPSVIVGEQAPLVGALPAGYYRAALRTALTK